ncbi:MAG: phosphocholine cytidylyltransferase family protein [Polyangiales bacterium]
MRAVILAAGVGSRLRPRTDDRPKAMVEVGGVPLLVRLAKQLAAVGVDELIIGTGYFEEAIAKVLPSLPMRSVLCRNDAYDRTQNIVSFHECRAALTAGGTQETLQLDGDLLLDDRLLPRLCAAPLADDQIALGVDGRPGLGAEEMKALVDHDRVIALGKNIEPSRAFGESIGVARLGKNAVSSIVDAVGAAVTAGETGLYYEDVWSRMLVRGLVARLVDVRDLRWTEIDTPEDLARAEQLARNASAN